jgi:isocitrate dehydrogenase
VLRTLEDGRAMTQDLLRQSGGDVDTATSTTGFTDAVIANLGKRPGALAPRRRRPAGDPPTPIPAWSYTAERYERVDDRAVGLDMFIATWIPPEVIGPELEQLAGDVFRLEFVDSRGTKVYPSVGLKADAVGLLRARFVTADGGAAVDAELLELQARVATRHPGWTHVEKLHVFDGVDGFTRAQGQ